MLRESEFKEFLHHIFAFLFEFRSTEDSMVVLEEIQGEILFVRRRNDRLLSINDSTMTRSGNPSPEGLTWLRRDKARANISMNFIATVRRLEKSGNCGRTRARVA